MKTYEQLMTHYWAVIVPMAEAAGIDPWLCVRCAGELTQHPRFIGNLNNYTFALTVLEKRPVFEESKLYNKRDGSEFIFGTNTDFHNATWTPPTKKRTFMLGDKELPCPVTKGEFVFQISGHIFGFNTFDDMQTVRDNVLNFLNEARDKE